MTLFNPVFNRQTPKGVKRLKTQADEGLTPADEAGYVVLRQPPASKLANLFRIDVWDHALGLVTQQLGGRVTGPPAGWVAWATNAITEGRARFRIVTQWFSRSGCWNRRPNESGERAIALSSSPISMQEHLTRDRPQDSWDLAFSRLPQVACHASRRRPGRRTDPPKERLDEFIRVGYLLAIRTRVSLSTPAFRHKPWRCQKLDCHRSGQGSANTASSRWFIDSSEIRVGLAQAVQERSGRGAGAVIQRLDLDPHPPQGQG